MAITDEQLQEILAAYKAGRTWALSLRPGMKFLGCNPAADSQGFTGVARHTFTTFALEVLEAHELRCDAEGIIKSYVPKRKRSA